MPEYFICPVCGAEVNWNETLYKTVTGEIVGCCECIVESYAENEIDEYEEEE